MVAREDAASFAGSCHLEKGSYDVGLRSSEMHAAADEVRDRGEIEKSPMVVYSPVAARRKLHYFALWPV